MKEDFGREQHNMQIIRNKKEKNKVDFLFLYDTKVREIESICLIAQELINRGYSVGIMDVWTPLVKGQKRKLSTEVLVVPAAYSDRSLYQLLSKIHGSAKVLNLQWEQVYCVRDITSPVSPWKMLGDTHKITHISWGNVNYDKLTRIDGIDSQLVKKVGHVGLDFLRPELRNLYLSREELFGEFSIDVNSKVCLFISSFSLVNLPENIYEEELRAFARISLSSQDIILQWIIKALDENEDITFVYRPHPAEAGNKKILDLQKKNNRFRVIRDYSVKQWIIASDVIYNWYSTSMAEIYAAGKSCFILRPEPMIDGFECLVLVNATTISTYEGFSASMQQNDCNLPIPLQNITDNYDIEQNEMTYLRAVDICENLYKQPQERLEYHATLQDRKDNIKLCLKNTLLGKCFIKTKRLIPKGKLSEEEQRNQEYQQYVVEMMENNHMSEQEFVALEDKIRSCLKQGNRGDL